ncbi:hypothetical protein N7456_013627 [Penicillium angulare]|uniref:Nucleoside phosphorylase domain-containing protein n=1 Tax=Penicillium angulare TaxID=116970 RepID=A0A9W9EFQ7_9EURO|nr:hypothetical protein N7456_013627 [Penicillium angulare]
MQLTQPADRHGFTIAIICALTIEADAIEELFDETYDRHGEIYSKQFRDPNSYVTGRIGRHNVVLCYMPGIGRGAAASVASSVRVSYTGVQTALVVGICGGVPNPSHNDKIYLGDVIISDSVIQFDFGRQYPGGFQRKMGVKDTLGRPNQEIRSLLQGLKARRARSDFQSKTSQYLQLPQQSGSHWQHPGSEDILFRASFTHKHRAEALSPVCLCFTGHREDDVCSEAVKTTCSKLACDENHIVRRRKVQDSSVSILIGTIASGDTVMKSGECRDRIAASGEENVLGFEMEGAGVWDNISCIVIKGVCDYADSHKNKDWQEYAAASGASATKAFLSIWVPISREDSPPRLNAPEIPRSPCFVGRATEMEELRSAFLSGGTFDRTLLLQGPPGIGKSALTVEYVERFRHKHKDIFWFDASSIPNLISSSSAIRKQINNKFPSTGSVGTVNADLFRRHTQEHQVAELWQAFAFIGSRRANY